MTQQNQIEQWDKESREDPVKAAAAARSADPFIKLPPLESLEIEGKRILDLGCGYGRLLLSLPESGIPKTLAGLDLSHVMLQKFLSLAKEKNKKVFAIQGSVTALPLKSEQWDLVIMGSLLLHLPRNQVSLVLHEVRRVLAPKGRLYLYSNFMNSKSPLGLQTRFRERLHFIYPPRAPNWVRTYSFKQLRQLLAGIGFSYFQIVPRYHHLIPKKIFSFNAPFKNKITSFNKSFEKRCQKRKTEHPNWNDRLFAQFFDVEAIK